MPIYKTRNLGKYGVISDIPSYDAPFESWSAANNIRFAAGRFEKMGGWVPFIKKTQDNDVPLVFLQEPESTAMLYATPKHFYKVLGNATPIDITPPPPTGSTAFGASPGNPWYYSVLSNLTIFNNEADEPYYWDPSTKSNSGQKLKVLPNWGVPNGTKNATTGVITPGPKVYWRTKKIVAYKNYLVALNMIESDSSDPNNAVAKPQRIRWSNVADVGGVPSNWYQNISDEDGGFNDLSDCYGAILDGHPMRDYFIIYTNRETYIMKYVGGQFVFDIQKLFPDSGILNTNCVVDFEGGNHFVVSEEDIFVHDGSTKQSVVTDLVKSDLLNKITATNFKATKVFAYPARKEIWVCYNTESAQVGASDNYACNKAAIWNWKDGTWTFADIPSMYWVESIVPPTSDIREWANPEGVSPQNPISQVILDAPIKAIAGDKTFRFDLLFKPGEGLLAENPTNPVTPGKKDVIQWTSSDESIAKMVVNPIDQSAIFTPVHVLNSATPVKLGKTTITAHLTDFTGSAFSSSFEVEVLAAGAETVDRVMLSDPAYNAATDAPPRPETPIADDPNNQWESSAHLGEPWEKKGFSFTTRAWIAASSDKGFYQLDTGKTWDNIDGTSQPVVAELQKFGISLQEVEDSLSRHKTFRTIYPLVSGQGTLRFQIGGSNDPYTPPSIVETQGFVIGDDYKVDCLTNYRFLSLNIRDEEEGEWSLSGMDIDYFFGGGM